MPCLSPVWTEITAGESEPNPSLRGSSGGAGRSERVRRSALSAREGPFSRRSPRFSPFVSLHSPLLPLFSRHSPSSSLHPAAMPLKKCTAPRATDADATQSKQRKPRAPPSKPPGMSNAHWKAEVQRREAVTTDRRNRLNAKKARDRAATAPPFDALSCLRVLPFERRTSIIDCQTVAW